MILRVLTGWRAIFRGITQIKILLFDVSGGVVATNVDQPKIIRRIGRTKSFRAAMAQSTC